MSIVSTSLLHKYLSNTVKIFSISPKFHFYDFSCLTEGWQRSNSFCHINFIIVLLILIFSMYLFVVWGFIVEVKNDAYGWRWRERRAFVSNLNLFVFEDDSFRLKEGSFIAHICFLLHFGLCLIFVGTIRIDRSVNIKNTEIILHIPFIFIVNFSIVFILISNFSIYHFIFGKVALLTYILFVYLVFIVL